MGYDPEGNINWKKILAGVIGLGLLIVVVAAVVISGGTLLIPVLIGATIGAGASLVGQGVGNLLSGERFFDDISLESVIMGGLAGAAFATGFGGLFGAMAIGATSTAGTSAWEDKSWANIGVSAFTGGLAAGLGYGIGKLMGRFAFRNSDFGFKDAFDIAILETNATFASVLAFRASYYTFLPAFTPGIVRGITKYLSNKGLKKF